MHALGKGEKAREFYERSLKLKERLAAAVPDLADYQRDMLVSLLRVSASDSTRQRACLLRGQVILKDLEARGAAIEQMSEFRKAFGLR